MRRLLLINLFWVWLIPVAVAQQQVSGTVTDFSNGEALPGVNILVQNTTNGTITDMDGNFSLEVPGPETVLVFSFIGYETQEVTVGNQTTITLEMIPDLTTLSEVVVVGYGTQKKSDVTGALVSVGAETISEVPAASNVTEALQGRLAGVNIQSTSSRPGGEAQIRIRGNRSLGSDESGQNDPLIVLDGIPYSGNIGDINPSTIQTVNVLKDASATAIYGSRGANGVILITTKRGKTGKAMVSYNGFYGISSALDHYDLFNAEEYAQFKVDSEFPTGMTDAELENLRRGTATDWQDLMYKNGFITSHDLGVSGGSENTQYAVNAGYFKETTVLPGQAYERYNLRTAIDQQIGERVKVGLSSMNTVSLRQGESVNPMFQMLTLSPLYDAYTEDGLINEYPAVGSLDQDAVNPLTLYREDSWSEDRRRLRTFNSLYGEVEILEGLKYRINVGLDYWQEEYGQFYGAVTPMNNSRNPIGNTASIRNEDTWSYTIENLIMYEKTFGDHNIKFTGLYSVQEEESNRSGVNATGVYVDYLQYYNFGLATNVTVPNNAGNQPFNYYRWGLISYMGRLNYSFQDRFLATVTVRTDGSSRLAEGNKYFTYPAGALAWNISNEGFMENINVVSNLKLRLGLGRTSNQAISPYQSLGSLDRRPYNYGSETSASEFGFLVSSLPNPELTWEFTTSANIGLDFGFVTNRITGSVDYYQTETTDVLQARNLPVTAGVPGNILQNIGSTEGKGIEFMVSAEIIESTDRNEFGWSVDFNLTAHQEKILKLADTVTRDVGNGWFVGEPVNVIYDYEKIGIWQLDEAEEADAFGGYVPGDIKVADNNPNGVLDPEDRTIIGQLDPEMTYGFTTRFTYRGFDLTAVLFGRVGGMLVSTLYQGNQGNPFNTLEGRRNGPDVDYWTVDNPTNAYPRTGLQQPQFGSTLGYFDADYMKIRSINLGYSFSDELLERAGIGSARIYLTADNPFKAFFSDYVDEGGIDPEPSGRDGNTGTPGLGRRLIVTPNTPITKTFILGVNLTF